MIQGTVSHYRIIGQLGAGAMGEVYEALDVRLDRLVALKFLPPDLCRDPDARARFVREAKAASRLDHPNVCVVHDVGETDEGQLYIVMARYEGETLRARLDRGPLEIDEALGVTRAIARGLASAHERDILHRDVKPGNVFLTSDGGVKILDFGLAKLARETTTRTQAGTLMGTAAYMSPEQARGDEVDARSDVWSLGVVLYEMLTSTRPFPGSDLTSVFHRILHDAPRPVRSFRSVPLSLELVVDRALAKDPVRRFVSAAEFLEALEAATSGDAPAGLGQRLSFEWRRRLPLTARVALPALLVVAMLGAGVALWRAGDGGAQVRSLAVLPFADLSSEEKEVGLDEAMSEALITELGRLHGVRVISRRSVLRFADSEEPLPDIADELGVDALVEASVVREDRRLRVAVRLVQAHPERQLWAGVWERPLGSVFALHAEIAAGIARAIGLVEAGNRTRRAPPEVDPVAYLAYVRGRHWWSKAYDTPEGIARSRAYFREAVKADSGFAAAWAGLVDTYISAACHNQDDIEKLYPLGREYVERALELDPDNPEALSAYAHLVWEHDYDHAAAERAWLRAIELAPSYAPARLIYGGGFLRRNGRFEEALEQTRVAQSLDPLSPTVSHGLAMLLWTVGRTDEALEVVRRTKAAFPDWDPSYDLSYLMGTEGTPEKAIAELEKRPFDELTSHLAGELIFLYAQAGRLDDARAAYERLTRPGDPRYVSPGRKANLLLQLGEVDYDHVLDLLEEAFQIGDPMLTGLRIGRVWDPLRGEPRFQALYRQVFPGDTGQGPYTAYREASSDRPALGR